MMKETLYNGLFNNNNKQIHGFVPHALSKWIDKLERDNPSLSKM